MARGPSEERDQKRKNARVAPVPLGITSRPAITVRRSLYLPLSRKAHDYIHGSAYCSNCIFTVGVRTGEYQYELPEEVRVWHDPDPQFNRMASINPVKS